MSKFLAYQLKTQLLMFKGLSRNPKFWTILGLDIFFVVLAHYLAYAIRFEHALEGDNQRLVIATIPLLIIVKIPIFYAVGLYRGMWRYTSLGDLINILCGTLLSSFIIVTVILYGNRFSGISRSVFILDTLFTFLFISGHRVMIRFYHQSSKGPRSLLPMAKSGQKKRLLLIGAGAAVERVLRELQSNNALPYVPVGLVDDNPAKTGLSIHGVTVYGQLDDLNDHILRTRAQEILISIASATGKEMKRIVKLCQDSQLPFKVLPGLGEIIDGKVSLKAMRDISYADLLGRKEVLLEQDKIGQYLNDKVVLVTGGGGSIGSELCRQIIRFSPKLLILFDAGEENLYSIQMELQHEHDFNRIVPVLGKVQDQGLLELVFKQYKPSVVFHAAAYKHVPLVERNPWQAINNNVFAAQLIIETSIIHGVNRFVLVSTDKAVRPTNVMGASKRLTELLMLAYGKNRWDGSFSPAREKLQLKESQFNQDEKSGPTHNTIFMAVRFGNVLGSSGSVIPLFKRQIANGGPITVTHPEITRYFMSIEEASQLILQAGAMGQGEEIFILKMGEPIKIAQMAKDLIKLAGREPDSEIEIKFIGLREGEKLYEELITEGEGIVATNHEKIMVLRGDGKTCVDLADGLEQLQQKTKFHDGCGIKETLQYLIPEYIPDQNAESI
jgi:FlaA1/EpsC-like NDP-sugar epimerase